MKTLKKSMYDITLPLSEKLLTYPRNPNFRIKRISFLSKGDSSNLSEFTCGTHSGTHIDAPFHIKDGAETIDKIPNESFFGRARVFDLTRVKKEINKKDLENFEINENEIILCKTRNGDLSYEKFNPDFVGLDNSAAEFLLSKKVKAIGVDYISIKRNGEKNKVHNILLENGIIIYEGLFLKEVPVGSYNFVGLPMKIIGADGAPARAFLM